jgi:hypothetical protein
MGNKEKENISDMETNRLVRISHGNLRKEGKALVI